MSVDMIQPDHHWEASPEFIQLNSGSKDTCPADDTAYVVTAGRWSDQWEVTVCQPVDFGVFARKLVDLHNLKHPEDPVREHSNYDYFMDWYPQYPHTGDTRFIPRGTTLDLSDSSRGYVFKLLVEVNGVSQTREIEITQDDLPGLLPSGVGMSTMVEVNGQEWIIEPTASPLPHLAVEEVGGSNQSEPISESDVLELFYVNPDDVRPIDKISLPSRGELLKIGIPLFVLLGGVWLLRLLRGVGFSRSSGYDNSSDTNKSGGYNYLTYKVPHNRRTRQGVFIGEHGFPVSGDTPSSAKSNSPPTDQAQSQAMRDWLTSAIKEYFSSHDGSAEEGGGEIVDAEDVIDLDGK